MEVDAIVSFFRGFHVHFLGCIETHGHGVSVGLSV